MSYNSSLANRILHWLFDQHTLLGGGNKNIPLSNSNIKSHGKTKLARGFCVYQNVLEKLICS